MDILDNQAILGSVLPSVHFKKIILESGGDINPLEKDNPHILDKDIHDGVQWVAKFAAGSDVTSSQDPSDGPKASVWDSTQPLDGMQDSNMTVTLNLTLKDVYDPKSDNTKWLFDQLFLNHVRLVIIQMAAYEPHVDPTAMHYDKKYENWLGSFNKTGANIKHRIGETGAFPQLQEEDTTPGQLPGSWTSEDYPDLCEGPFDIPCSGPGISFGEGSNIKDYIIRSWPLREVIENGIPQLSELAYGGIGGADEPSMTGLDHPQVQKKMLHNILTGNRSAYGESSPVTVENLPSGHKVINIPFSTTFTVGKENPYGLSFLAYTWFDFTSATLWEPWQGGFGEDSHFYDSPLADYPIPVGFGPDDGWLEPDAFDDVVRSPGNVKSVIVNKKINKTDTVFLLPSGAEWFGNIKAVDMDTGQALSLHPTKDNAYVTGKSGASIGGTLYNNIGWYTYHPASGGQFTISNEQRLTLIKKPEAIISDFRALAAAEKILIDFKDFQDDIASSDLLGSYEPNIVLPEKGVFSDLQINLEHEVSTDTTSPFQYQWVEWDVASYFFSIDVRSILEKNSLFSWVYNLEETPMAMAGTVPLYINAIIKHANAGCRIRDFKIKRRAVQDKKFHNESIKDMWIPSDSEDVDPHTDGYILEGEPGASAIISKGLPSYQKSSPFKDPAIAGADSVSNFSLDPGTAMELEFSEVDGVSWAGKISKVTDKFYTPEMTEDNTGLLHITGVDRRIPKTGKKRYQYGVSFKVKDGFVNTLRTLLGEGSTYDVDIGPLSLYATLGTTLIESEAGILRDIRKYIDLVTINPHNPDKQKFNVVNSTTNLFSDHFQAYISQNNLLPDYQFSNAVRIYFSVLKLFSTVKEYQWLHEGDAWKITTALNQFEDQLTSSLGMQNLIKSISPHHGGSAQGFLLFQRMFSDMVHLVRKVLDHSSASSNSFKSGTQTGEIVTVDPATNKSSISDDIEKEHWFPQTLVGPMYGKSGYSYTAFVPDTLVGMNIGNSSHDTILGEGENGISHITLNNFDLQVEAECAKYFINTHGQMAQIQQPPGLALNPADFLANIDFGWSSDTKHTFMTLKGTWLNEEYIDLDITKPVDMGQMPGDALNAMKVDYANTLLRILTRADMDKGAHPQDFSGNLVDNDSSLSKQDQILLSKLILNKSCVVNPQLEKYSAAGGSGPGDVPDAEQYENLFITDYDAKPADQLEAFSDEYYGYFAPDKKGAGPDGWSIYQTEKLSFYTFLLMQLVIHDELAFFANLDLSKYRVTNNPSANFNSMDYLTQLIAAKNTPSGGSIVATWDSVVRTLRKLPNPIKYMFQTINRSSESTEQVSDEINTLGIRRWLYDNGLSEYLFGAPDNTVNIKELYAMIYFNFFNIAKIEYFAGYGKMQDGTYSVKHPIWKPLMSYGGSTAATNEGDAEPLKHMRSSAKATRLLCRYVPWEGGELLRLGQRYSKMPLIGKYFFLKASGTL